MLRVFGKLLVASLCVNAITSTTLAEEKSAFWVLHEKEFLCLKNSVDIYLEANRAGSPNDRILIFTAECPETNIAKLFASRTQNTSSLPSVELDGQNEAKPAEIISLLPDQLRCLKSLDLKAENKLVQLPKEPCL